MERKQIFEIVGDKIREMYGLPIELLTENTDLVSDLGFDIIDKHELVMFIEVTFKISNFVGMFEIENLNIMKDIIDRIEKCLELKE